MDFFVPLDVTPEALAQALAKVIYPEHPDAVATLRPDGWWDLCDETNDFLLRPWDTARYATQWQFCARYGAGLDRLARVRAVVESLGGWVA